MSANGSLISRQKHVHRTPATVPMLAALLWWWPVALILAFSGNFTPVVFRYLVPVLPPLLVLGVAAAMPILLSVRRFVALAALISLVTIAAVSDVRGIEIYRDTVTVTNQCWVVNAVWIRDHIPADALLATHDIGAIGYFDHNKVIDIAGLVSPEVIPLLGNERAIEDYLQQRHVKYVMMWDYWFPPPTLIAHQYAHQVVYSGCGNKFDLYATDW